MRFVEDLLRCAGEGNEYMVVGCVIIGLIFVSAWIVS